MGNKQIEGVITDYFNALLDEGCLEDAMDDKTIDVAPAPQVDTPVQEKKEKPTVSVEAAPVTEITPQPEASPEIKPEKAIVADIPPPAPVSTPKPDTGYRPPVGETKPESVARMEPQVSSASQESTTAYEHHKQRLEKMLQQVSALETSTEIKTETADITLKPTQVEDQQQALELSEIATETAYQPLPPLSSEWLENGRPNWAQERFDILLIEVNGLQLAVPLVALGQIQPMDEKLTPLFGQSDWFMGLQQSPMGSIKTVNTAKFVMPERYQNDHNYQYVVSINGLNWGLAVDSIHQPISIDPEAIRWRANRSSRPWMAGMVKDHMCVLLDIPSMGELLQKQDKNHRETTGG